MKNTAKIFIRVLSLYFFLEFLGQGLPQLIGIFFSGRGMETGIIVSIITVQIYKMLIAICLWWGAEKVAVLMVGEGD